MTYQSPKHNRDRTTTQALSTDGLLPIDRQMFAVLQALALAAIVGYTFFAVYHFLTTGLVVGGDFIYFWTAAQIDSPKDVALAYSGDLFSTDAAVRQWGPDQRLGTWPYPPQALVLLTPFHGLPYGLSFALWEALGIVALALATWVVFGRSGHAAAFAVLAPAAFFSLWVGQSGLFASALLIAGIGLLDRRPILAGVLIGLLTFKPTAGVLVPFALLAGGHWRTIISASLTAGALIFASIMLFGREAWVLYATNVPSFQMGAHATQIGAHATDENLIVNLVPTVFMAVRLFGFDTTVAYTIQGLVAIVVLTVIVWAFLDRRRFSLNCGLLFVGTALASPFFHTYDMSYVTVAIYLLLQDMMTRVPKAGERSIAVLCWLIPFLVYFLNSIVQIPVGPFLLGLLFVALLRRRYQGPSNAL